MSTTIKVVFRPSSKNNRKGHLHIRSTTNRKSKFKSLGIELSRIHWDDVAQRVLPSLKKSYKSYNQKIAKALKELSVNDNNLEALKNDAGTIIDFWTNHNSTTTNAGTANIRKSSFRKFHSFLQKSNQLNLNFRQLSPQVVQQYHLYLLRDLNPRSCKTYMGYFKSVVNQAIKQQKIPTYPVDPFMNVVIPSYKNKKAKALTIDEIRLVMDADLSEKRSYFRDMFCFQILSGGMRVRDMIMLRWENVIVNDSNIYLQYYQQKTGKQITSKLSYKALKYLHRQFEQIYGNRVKGIDNLRGMLNSQINLREQWIKANKYSKFEDTTLKDFRHYDFKEQKTYNLDKIKIGESKELTLQQNIAMYEEDLRLEYVDLIRNCNKTKQGEYIFDLLGNLDIPKKGSISTRVNAQIMGQISKYNYHLKKISEKLDIPKITSHQARHSFTQLLVNSNTNLYFIQQLLGHSSLGVTQNYVNSLHTTQLDEVSDTIAGHF